MSKSLENFDDLISSIEKQHGAGSIMLLGGKKFPPVEVSPTGSLSLDVALGVGGVPKGRIIEIYGPESGGKTTMALQIVASAQKMGGNCAVVDAEHALDPKYAAALGVDTQHLLISQPDNGEQALEIVESLVNSGKMSVIVVDSVAALVPKAEIEGDMGDAQMGLQARLMSQAMRKLAGIINRTHTTVIFINQIREKIGVMFGNPETTTGGRALKFYASIRMDVRKVTAIKDGDVVIGAETRVKVVKNKVAAPHREAMLRLYHGTGFSKESDLLTLGSEKGIISKVGAWYSFHETKIGQGLENARAALLADAVLTSTIESDLRELLFSTKKG